MKLITHFGQFGGVYAPEILIKPLQDIEQAFIDLRNDAAFNKELTGLLKNYAGRATPLTFAHHLSQQVNHKIYLKREDLLHGGAHKTNNALGQGLLAKYMGKKRIIAETGAGQHGVATAMVGALLGIPVEIYMGAVDMQRQAANVQRMQLFGAQVHPVTSGTATLKDAVNQAMREWTAHVEDTFYLFGSAAGPHPFPTLVRHFQSVIGIEARQQIIDATGKLPDAVFACIGGGSNAIGMFSAFLNDADVKLYAAEAAGAGLHTQQHAATLAKGRPGIFHGMLSYFLQTNDGQIQQTHSISAGLDYPGVGPEHADLFEKNRVHYLGVTDKEALHAYSNIAKSEGILAALESCHAIALALRVAENFAEDACLLINVSGRGDKDLATYTQSISICDEAHAQTSSGVYKTVHEQRDKHATKSQVERRRVYVEKNS